MSDDFTVVRYVTLADGRMLGLGDQVSRADLTDPDSGDIVPHNQALLDDEQLLPVDQPADDAPPTVRDLRKRAGDLGIEGRSDMSREQLERAIADAVAAQDTQTAGNGEEVTP